MPPRRLSSARLAWLAARASFALIGPGLRELWRPLLILHVAELFFSQAMSAMQERVLARGGEDIFAIVVFIAWQVLFSALWSCAYLSIVGLGLAEIAAGRAGAGVRKLDWFRRLTQVANQTLIETVRVWSELLRWGLLLIVPAGFAYVRLYWAPLIAALDLDYDAGRVDALARSRELTRGRWWLTAAIAFASAALPLAIGFAIQGNDDRLFDNPARVIGSELAGGLCAFALFAWAVSAFALLKAEADPVSS